MVKLIINGKPIIMRRDKASDISIMSEKTAKTIPNLLLEASLPTLVAGRIQRKAIILGAYHYDIEYNPTSKMGNTEASSRFPVDKAPAEYNDRILLGSVYDVPITAKDIAQNTKKDPILTKILESLMAGKDLCGNHTNFKSSKDIWSELSKAQDFIVKMSKVIIPRSLRNKVLSEMHVDHQGLVRSKSIARTFIWFPGVDRVIELFIRNTLNYVMQQNNTQFARIHPWELPRYPINDFYRSLIQVLCLTPPSYSTTTPLFKSFPPPLS
ncbi:uncharacterized protein [Palaemon carinicauda]|uniref:uncharacterized protein n=1 Tax=Palaemon carinicauda TaxID=392227 RepID=UPI0035B66548